jgi:hypothetical protein
VAILTLLGFWWGLARWVLSEFSRRDLGLQAESVRAKMVEDGILRALEAHKLYSAENYATSHELANAIEGFKASIDRLSDRLDQFLIKRTEQ